MMGAVRTVVGTVTLVGFVSALAVRPVSNPALTAALDDGLFTWTTLLALPVVLVVVALVGYRIRSLVDTGETTDSESHWNVAPPEKPKEREPFHESGVTTSDSDADDGTVDDSVTYRTPYLTGQGGTRNREFEYEQASPDADLSAHLEHLQAELGDEKSHASDLATMAEVVEQVDDDRVLPDRCPHEYCDTPWTEQTFLRDPSRNYEILEDGKTVLCLNCEQTVTLDEELDS
jgi:hypothetical protein